MDRRKMEKRDGGGMKKEKEKRAEDKEREGEKRG